MDRMSHWCCRTPYILANSSAGPQIGLWLWNSLPSNTIPKSVRLSYCSISYRQFPIFRHCFPHSGRSAMNPKRIVGIPEHLVGHNRCTCDACKRMPFSTRSASPYATRVTTSLWSVWQIPIQCVDLWWSCDCPICCAKTVSIRLCDSDIGWPSSWSMYCRYCAGRIILQSKMIDTLVSAVKHLVTGTTRNFGFC